MSIMDWIGEHLAELQAEFPDHDIWHVRFSGVRAGLWCARPKGWPIATVHADDVDGLRRALRGGEAPEEPVTGKLFSVKFPRQDTGQL